MARKPRPKQCKRCGERPVPPSAGGGRPPVNCLSCSRDLGHRYDRTLERIAKKEGVAAAQAAAKVGGVELPEQVALVDVAGSAPEAGAVDADTPPALALRLLAVGLSVTDDPREACELVGIPVPKNIKELAKLAEAMPISKGDTRAVAAVIQAAGAVTALRSLGHAGRGEPVAAAKSAAASRSLWQAHESLTGGGKPTPSVVNVVFKKADVVTT